MVIDPGGALDLPDSVPHPHVDPIRRHVVQRRTRNPFNARTTPQAACVTCSGCSSGMRETVLVRVVSPVGPASRGSWKCFQWELHDEAVVAGDGNVGAFGSKGVREKHGVRGSPG